MICPHCHRDTGPVHIDGAPYDIQGWSQTPERRLYYPDGNTLVCRAVPVLVLERGREEGEAPEWSEASEYD